VESFNNFMYKIAYIGQKGILNPAGGGVETHVEELSYQMVLKGHEVFLYTRPHYTPKEYTAYEGVKLVSLPSIHTKHLDAISHTFVSLIHAIFKNKVDIIHFHGVGPSLLTFLPKLISPKVKVISTAHSQDWEHSKWGFFSRQMLKMGAFMSSVFSDEVITVSKELQKRFLTKYSRSITLIPNGVNASNKNTKDTRLLNSFGLKKNKYILVVSRIVKHKGIHYLIEAFKEIKAKKKFKDFKLVVVGQTSFTNSYFGFLKKMIAGEKNIMFVGGQRGEALEQLFSNALLYVSPSTSEGLSISLLEAMGYGKPVLVSDIKENLELINGDANLGSVGFSFKNKNIIDLKEKLELLLADPVTIRKVGKKAKEFVKVYYNWSDIAERTNKIYKLVFVVKNKEKDNMLKKLVFAWNRIRIF